MIILLFFFFNQMKIFEPFCILWFFYFTTTLLLFVVFVFHKSKNGRSFFTDFLIYSFFFWFVVSPARPARSHIRGLYIFIIFRSGSILIAVVYADIFVHSSWKFIIFRTICCCTVVIYGIISIIVSFIYFIGILFIPCVLLLE